MSEDNQDDALYRIGITNDNRVSLTVGYPTSITLTMNSIGTRRLIKLLEAAIIEEEEMINDD